MIYSLVKTLSRPISVAVFLFLAWPIGAAEQPGVWETLLKESYFKGVNIIEDNAVIELETPSRAEDPALTPLSIKAKIPQTPERYMVTQFVKASGGCSAPPAAYLEARCKGLGR